MKYIRIFAESMALGVGLTLGMLIISKIASLFM